MGGCQNYGPFLGNLNIKGRTIIGTQKGTIILTTTHIKHHPYHKALTACLWVSGFTSKLKLTSSCAFEICWGHGRTGLEDLFVLLNPTP